MTQLTPEIRKEIAKDWQELFPELEVYKTSPIRLAKRFGPIVISICLDRDSGNDNYRPLTHIYCLCQSSPHVFFSLPQMLKGRKGASESIPVIAHKERYKDAAARLESQSVLDFRKDLTFSDVINFYHAYVEWQKTDPFYRPTYLAHNYEDILLLYTWIGKPYEETKKLLDSYRSEMSHWPNKSLAFLGEYGLQGWYDKMDAIIKDREKVLKTVEDEVVAHKLEKIPYHDLPLK